MTSSNDSLINSKKCRVDFQQDTVVVVEKRHPTPKSYPNISNHDTKATVVPLGRRFGSRETHLDIQTDHIAYVCSVELSS